MIKEHLNELIHIGDDDQGYIGNNSLNWGSSILANNAILDPFLNQKFNRYDLFAYCNNPDNNNLNVLTAILSWGGMRRDHARQLMKNYLHLEPLIIKLRNGQYQTRASAFIDIQNKRKSGYLPGLGIGYFTKLICFLSPKLNGYIMDQWVSKSINLLTGDQIVNLTNNSWVNDNNNSVTYELFCSKIDELAEILNCSGFEAEKRVFSVGRGIGHWRNYLIQKYP